MCHYQRSPHNEDYEQSIGNGIGHVDPRLEARVAMLEARMTNIEARVERLESRLLYLQKGMRVVFALLVVTLAYAICK